MYDSGLEILLRIKMLESGIIPYSMADRHCAVPMGLQSVHDGDALLFRRKFRKIFRKALREKKDQPIYYRNLCRSCGVGLPKRDLRYHHMNSRALLVLKYLDTQ